MHHQLAAILIKSFLREEEVEVPDDFQPYGISMGASGYCMRYNSLNYHRPKVVEGIKMIYMKSEVIANEGQAIMGMGHTIEGVYENILRRKGVLISAQDKVRGLDNKWRGYLDYLVKMPHLGYGIGDCKGMSDKKYSRFLNRPLKESFPEYYAQLVPYLHLVGVDFGFILGVNRSTGKYEVRVVSREETTEDFLELQRRVKFSLDHPHPCDIDMEEDQCDYCQFYDFCRDPVIVAETARRRLSASKPC